MKKILAVFLSIMMCINGISISVLAEESDMTIGENSAAETEETGIEENANESELNQESDHEQDSEIHHWSSTIVHVFPVLITRSTLHFSQCPITKAFRLFFARSVA